MYYLIVILLVGINFAPFVFFTVDIWHAQGFFAQLMILLMYSCSLVQRPMLIDRNIPLALLNVYLGLWTAFFCYLSLLQGKYNVSQFFPYFNFFCLLVFYQCVVQYMDKIKIEKVMEYMRGVLIVTLLLCVLQHFGLVWFMKLLRENDQFRNNPVVGFIGNGVHLSGFLAMCAPLLFRPARENILALLLLFLVLFNCGMSKTDPSITGFVVLGVVGGIYLMIKNRRLLLLLILFMVIPFCVLDMYMFLNPNGRMLIWNYYWNVATHSFGMLGVGLGKINQVYQHTPFPNARHVHMEYLQYFVEAGIIGIGLILNMIVSFLRKRIQTDTQLTLYLIVLGFLISCIFNFSSHLWLFTTWAMFAYAAFICIERENARID